MLIPSSLLSSEPVVISLGLDNTWSRARLDREANNGCGIKAVAKWRFLVVHVDVIEEPIQEAQVTATAAVLHRLDFLRLVPTGMVNQVCSVG